ncbi:MAG: superoxide dismutase [Nitrospirae bacterium GWD2_57_9]|nr:MAG: superoxide dismutase [Nitrospirae bacterium GWD2_57_9]OGW47984.1 MAG: superoxide dismutase [Nitrospirae bacterium GWC2_57_9]
MPYAAKDFSSLIGMQGFSETLLKNHFTLYQGYVKNTNKLLDDTTQMCRENRVESPEYAETKRRLGWEFDGMRLHELYFGNLGGSSPLNKSGSLAKNLSLYFGSIENWEKDFRGTGMMRGIGWSILYQDATDGRLVNFWINEHDGGHPAGCNPLLIMDVFEHAFMTDYQVKKADYIEAFMMNINWPAVESRLEQFPQAMKKAG